MAERLGTQLQSGGLEQSIHTGLLGSGLFGGASLDLNFAVTKNVGPLVTFTRASNATYIDSAGTLRTAVTNLLLRSEEFGTTWSTGDASITTDTTTAPNGTTTADKLVENSLNAQHNVRQAFAASNVTLTFSVYVKAAERTRVFLQISNNSTGAAGLIFNLSSGTAGTPTSSGDFTSTSGAIVAVGNGWYRCSITTNKGSTNTTAWPFVSTVNNSDVTSYLGDGTSGLFLWGAQLEQSSTVGEYIPTTSATNSAPRFDHNPTTGESLGLLVEEQRTNLLLRSEEFDNASWSKVAATVTANSAVSPSGASTADKLIEDSTTSEHYSRQTSPAYTAGATTTMSVYVKAAERTSIRIRSLDAAAPANGFFGSVDTSTGTIAGSNIGTGTFTSATATSVGNGWWRLSVVGIASATATSSIFDIFLLPGNANSASTYAGNGTSGIFFWGAQLEAGAFPTSYIPTTTAAVTRSADVASITGTNFGTTRTNYIRNNTMVGAVAGTPGTAPTGWSSPASQSGLAVNVVGTGIENGINYIDFRFFGTTTSALFGNVSFESTTSVAATQSSLWTNSAYLKLAEGSTANVNAVRLVIDNYNNLGTPLTQYAVSLPISVSTASLGSQRFSASSLASTFSNAATAFVRPYIQIEANSGVAIDITLRIGMPQLELGSTATTVIPTTTAAVSVFESSWYRQDEGTVFASAGVQDFTQTNFPRLFSIDRGDISSNFIAAVRGNTTRRLDYSVFADGIGQAVGLNNGIAPAANTTVSGAWVYKANDFIGAVNGVLTNSDTSGSVPTLLTTFGVGMQGNATLHYNGTIRRLTYFPQRLPNSTLEAITR